MRDPDMCKHNEVVVPVEMALPALGVVGLCECKKCGMIVGNCQWFKKDERTYELKFSLPSIDPKNN